MKHRHYSQSDRQRRSPYVERLTAQREREAREEMQTALSTNSEESEHKNA